MRSIFRLLLVLCTSIFFAIPSRADDTNINCQGRVDVAIVLALDVSESMDRVEWALEKKGYVEAFLDEKVVSAITSGSCGRIAVTVVQWGGMTSQQVAIPWKIINGRESARAFSKQFSLLSDPVSRGTYIGQAVMFSIKLFESPYANFVASEEVIDMSGDGTESVAAGSQEQPYSMSFGTPASVARQKAQEAGITINGLPIVQTGGGLESFYKTDVATVDGFVQAAYGYLQFGSAIIDKLRREILLSQN